MTALDVVAVAVCLGASVLAALRWLRVAQREHYLSGAATRFALRWWFGLTINRVLIVAATIGVVLSPLSPFTAISAGLALMVGPFRMSLLGRAPGPLVWTRRLRTLAVVLAGLTVVPVAVAALVGAAVPVAALAALLSPLLVDAACALVAPAEDRLAHRFVDEASRRLAEVAPTVVGITGSYGKTSTKAYVAHLCAPSLRVVASPASFNNRAGLSRAINEGLTPGTEVFVAEMGTYGPGEIAELCSWCPPRVAAITAIGPVHLERFGTEDAIVAAKQEIFGSAQVAVLNVDDPRLAVVADDQQSRGLRVWRCSSTDASAGVCARPEGDQLVVSVRGEPLATVAAPGVQPTNAAVAVAIALELGVGADAVASGLATLPPVANRQTVTTLTTGATALDDTFNANPAGCRAAVASMVRLASPQGKRVVVTPGMVELGSRQHDENLAFGQLLASAATHVLIVGWTNRSTLIAGLEKQSSAPTVLCFDSRHEAVAWVRLHTGPGDAVLYENDLPDHYP